MSINITSPSSSTRAAALLVTATGAVAPALRLANGIQLAWHTALEPAIPPWRRAAFLAGVVHGLGLLGLGTTLTLLTRYLVLGSYLAQADRQAALLVLPRVPIQQASPSAG